MSVTTTVFTPRTLITEGTSCAAGSFVRGTLDLRGKLGAVVTIKLTNGATGPTVQAVVTLHVAHTADATPVADAAGSVWKRYYLVGGGGTTANAINEWSIPVDGIAHLQVEIGGNTGQAVTCECFATELSSMSSV